LIKPDNSIFASILIRTSAKRLAWSQGRWKTAY